MTRAKTSSARFGLLPRIAVALGVVALLPLGVLAFGLFDANREAMRDQVKRTHSVAVRATARQIDGHLAARRAWGRSLASNRALVADPRSVSGQEVLAATLESQEGVAAVLVRDPEGVEVVRAQYPDLASSVERIVSSPGQAPVEYIVEADHRWLRFTVDLEDGRGTLELIEAAGVLHDLLVLDELGRHADLLLVDAAGTSLALSSPRAVLPGSVRAPVTSRKVFGAQVVESEQGALVVAMWPLTAAPWTVVSVQPTIVAEDLVARLRRRSELALGIALGLTLVVVAVAYRSLVRPIRGIIAAQRSLSRTTGSGRSELEELQASFEELRERVRLKEELEDVFLGRYQVIELIAEGGMGSVFRGWDPKLKRPVALKTIQLQGEASRSALKDKLVEEAVATARFNHPHIVGVYDAADSVEAAYVAMELVEGVSLAVFMWEQGRLEAEAAVPIVACIASALETAHSHGLVHRDVKPGNVLLGYDGGIKVSDFGIATFLSGLRGDEGQIFGTPGYIAPEVARGEPWEPASDCFALGVILYECLTGRAPFGSKTARQILVNTVVRYPPPLREVQPDVSPAIDGLCSALMAKNPGERPQANVAAEALLAIVQEWGWEWSFPLTEQRRVPPHADTGSTVWLPTLEAEALDTDQLPRDEVTVFVSGD